MSLQESHFTIHCQKNGKPHLALINIKAEKSDENQIIENYSGKGFTSQGAIEEIPENGCDEWKEAARRGIAFVLERTKNNWIVTINTIGGRVFMETNPNTIGYATILALCEKTEVVLDDITLKKLNDMLYYSWDYGDFALPNFENFSYEYPKELIGEPKKEQHPVPQQANLPWYTRLVRGLFHK